MRLTEKQQSEFIKVVNPVIKFMSENTHTHCMVIIDNTKAELFEGESVYVNKDHLLDKEQICCCEDPVQDSGEYPENCGNCGNRLPEEFFK